MTKEEKKEYMKKWRQDNKEKIKVSTKKYREENQDKIRKYQKKYSKEYRKKYRKKNKHKCAEYYKKNIKDKNRKATKQRQSKNKCIVCNVSLAGKIATARYCTMCKKKRVIEWKRQEYKRNIKKYREYYKNNYEKNKQKKNEYKKKYRKKRRKTDPVFKLKRAIGTTIRDSLRNRNYTKKSRTHEILGCSYEDFIVHLNNNTYGFTYGQDNLDVDHIVPISSATTEEEVIKLNHYTNFQLLPSYYNQHVKRNNQWDKEDFERWLKNENK